jgi:magnesium transporter
MAKKEQTICGNKQWIDITDPSKEEMLALSQQFNLNEHIVQDCMQPEHLPKYESVDEVNFLILRYYSREPDAEVTTIQELSNKIAIFYTSDFVLTIRKHDIPFLETLRQSYVNKGSCASIEQMVIRIIWQALETFDSPAQRLSESVDFHENSILLHRAGKEQLEALYHIKRKASISHRILMLTLEPINHIRTQLTSDPALQDVKDQHLKMQMLYTQVLEDVNNLMNLYISYSAQRTNDVMRVLTIFSAFFLPLTFIVGVYGMNFEFMPELSKKWGYPAVLLLMAAVTIGIFTWFKKRKWL